MTLVLHDYQIVARDFLRGRSRAGLWLDMGLGKSACVLSAFEPRHLPALVVAPKRVAEAVWPAQRDLWRPDLTLALAAGPPVRRSAALAAEADLTVIGRDNLRDVPADHRYRTVVLDESSGFKSGGRRGSVRWKAAARLVKDPAVGVFELTGTPSPNGYGDLWAQVYLLDGGTRLGRTLSTYRDRYFRPGGRLPNGVVTGWDLREGAAERIDALLEDLCLSMRTEGRVVLPPVTYNVVDVPLPPAVTAAYRRMKRDMVVDLRDVFDGEVHSAASAAVLSNRLSQVVAGFVYVDDADLRGRAYTELHREKARAAAEIVEGTGSPVLVFYRYEAELDLLRREIPAGVALKDPRYRQADWDAGRVPVLFAHPRSAGHGLNLQHGGRTIVWTSLDWDLELWEQANARLARQGQEHPVIVHVLRAPGTVDDVIRAVLVDKAVVQDALMTHLESPV